MSVTKKSRFWIKLTQWEYWPIWLAYIPIVFCWLGYAIRTRRLFFFSAVNPAIPTGGVFGEEKMDILNRIPRNAIPITLFVPKNQSFTATLEALKDNQLRFPIIAKPNVGERGLLVKRVASPQELEDHIGVHKIDWILQELIDYPLEASVLYYRYPERDEGYISSVCIKEFLTVIGDGQSTIEELMSKDDRAFLQLPRFRTEQPDLLQQVPEKDTSIILEKIGNHSRGTKFVDGSELITPAMIEAFHQVGRQMDGIHYGRFDLRCTSKQDLQRGSNFKVLEFNGVAGEPAHIYDPKIPFLEKYRIYFRHWRVIYEIYRQQEKRQVPTMTIRELRAINRSYQAHMRKIQG